MRPIRLIALLFAMLTVAGCATQDQRFLHYDGPEVTHVLVEKSKRRMYLLHHGTVLQSHRIDLGFAPDGDKKVQGDGRTPEGDYRIDKRNPNSAFHLSIGISYPNRQDIAEAIALGRSPGGDIFIHGEPNDWKAKGRDWTEGCIAVTNAEMRRIYAMVQNGTPIRIKP
ncbi:murein L,D-transpeptidase family protein [Cognatishimia sp. F0-27]|uniref:L,D-transpeptidase family protein n=1 Tax=Cognatishimia sp. F0-27 TaxID=2816855 RepID=UPI001D0C13EE|nr:L,D-transpeptidase family protein [Cognatishimia sp. F0-27]MCC1492483.1 L,D-transpeptidase family protein [Cognatishimia sp. F0-27]